MRPLLVPHRQTRERPRRHPSAKLDTSFKMKTSARPLSRASFFELRAHEVQT